MLKRTKQNRKRDVPQLSDSDSDSDGEFAVDASAPKVSAAESGFMSLGELQQLGRKTRANLRSKKKGGKDGNDAAQDGDEAGEDKEPVKGVVYLGHIPHGFYEEQMRGFFGQFGTITRLRLSRSKKTGRSRHYAFIQFEEPRVAEVVVDTMNGYILEGRHLVCRMVPPQRVHARMFDGANGKFRHIPWRTVAKNRHNAKRDPQKRKTKLERLMRKENAKRRRLKEMGLDYEFEGYRGIVGSVVASRGEPEPEPVPVKSSKKAKSKKTKKKGAAATADQVGAAATAEVAKATKGKTPRKTPARRKRKSSTKAPATEAKPQKKKTSKGSKKRRQSHG